jgi:hypothetical protein
VRFCLAGLVAPLRGSTWIVMGRALHRWATALIALGLPECGSSSSDASTPVEASTGGPRRDASTTSVGGADARRDAAASGGATGTGAANGTGANAGGTRGDSGTTASGGVRDVDGGVDAGSGFDAVLDFSY